MKEGKKRTTRSERVESRRGESSKREGLITIRKPVSVGTKEGTIIQLGRDQGMKQRRTGREGREKKEERNEGREILMWEREMEPRER